MNYETKFPKFGLLIVGALKYSYQQRKAISERLNELYIP